MLARFRCLGAGAALGFAIQKVSEAVSEDPSTLQDALGSYAQYLPLKDASAVADTAKTVALVRMSGTIEAPRPSAFGEKSVNLANYEKQLANAFKSPGCAAVVLEINSPGGSPVQSALLHNRLKALREKHPEVALLCFCTDICASGGYYIASACDEIHVLPSSLVGSIGGQSHSPELSPDTQPTPPPSAACRRSWRAHSLLRSRFPQRRSHWPHEVSDSVRWLNTVRVGGWAHDPAYHGRGWVTMVGAGLPW